MNIPFDILQWASGFYLTDAIPNEWKSLSESEKHAYLAEKRCIYFENISTRELLMMIELLAKQAIKKFNVTGHSLLSEL